jgi:hypothetical protein
MDSYQTPIRKKKPRFLGMTLAQAGLLAGMIVVQLVILVLALKYIVFAPKTTVVPTVTPVALAPAVQDTLAPTPVPDLTTGVLTMDDLPGRFLSLPDEEDNIEFGEVFTGTSLQPTSSFSLFEADQAQVVAGWTFDLTDPAEKENFDQLVIHSEPLVVLYEKHWQAGSTSRHEQLKDPVAVGELTSGWKMITSAEGQSLVSDMVIFSNKNYGGVVLVMYEGQQTPVVPVWEVAQRLDNRLRDVLVTGPIPTPVVIAYEDLAGVKLTAADLPVGFLTMSEDELAMDEVSRGDLEQAGMRLVGVFGLVNNKLNAEETILGYTFQFTSTLGKAVMDQMLAGNEMLDIMFAPTPTQKRQPLPINKPVGDRAFSTAIMEMTQTGGVRCDVLTFRRGNVGAALFYIYVTGRRQTTVEDLAVKLDAKIQALISP